MSKEADSKPKDLTNRLIIENIKVISQDMRLIKQSLLKLMNDVNYAITQGDVVSQILEEAQIAGKDEIPALVEQVIEERDKKVKGIFDEILEQVEKVNKVSKEDEQIAELKKLLKNSPTEPGEA